MWSLSPPRLFCLGLVVVPRTRPRHFLFLSKAEAKLVCPEPEGPVITIILGSADILSLLLSLLIFACAVDLELFVNRPAKELQN